MREQWLRRLLKNPLLTPTAILEPLAREELALAARQGQTVFLSLDQTELGDRMAVLTVSVRVGDRALPVAWRADTGAASIGFAGQRQVLEQVLVWLPPRAEVLLSADRFYPSVELFVWLHAQGWRYRLRLKGNLLAEPGYDDDITTGELAQGVTERYLAGVRLFAAGVVTFCMKRAIRNRGSLRWSAHRPGPLHWIMAPGGRSGRCFLTSKGVGLN